MFTPSQGHRESFLGRKKKGREEGNERIPGVEALPLSPITLIENNRSPCSGATPVSNMPQEKDGKNRLTAKANSRTHDNTVLE